MADSAIWDMTPYLSNSQLELALLVDQSIEFKDFVVLFEIDEEQAFLDANPGFVRSDSLQAPYRYVPGADRVPGLVTLGQVEVPDAISRLVLRARAWSRAGRAARNPFSVAVLSTAEAKGARLEFVVPASTEIAA